MVHAKTSAPKTGTATESLAERSILNAYNVAKARTRGWCEHVAKRLHGSDVWKAYLSKLPPGVDERLAFIAVQAMAENFASAEPSEHPPECLRKGLAIWNGAERGPRAAGAGPGCEDCAFTGSQIDDEDRAVVPCASCASSLVIADGLGAVDGPMLMSEG